MGRVTRSSSKVEAQDKKKPVPKSTSQEKEDPKPSKKVKQTKSKSKSKDEAKSPAKEPAKEPAKKAEETAKEPAKQLKKLIIKGKIPVDQYFSKLNESYVYSDGSTDYATTLNQSNIQNNNNKFYILQILKLDGNDNHYYFFTRWGRVGVPGQQAEIGPLTKDQAIHQYQAKLKDKIKGNYRVVEMNYDAGDQKEEKEEEEEKKEKKEEVSSELEPRVQELVRLIFDMKMMNNQMKEIGYDSKKMPLGKLAKSSILKGYESLKLLMEEVKGKKRHEVLNQHSSDFYSNIPHDFGFKHMSHFILDSEQKVKAKLEMLQSLEDIQVFTKLLQQGKISSDMNLLDSNYLKLNTEIKPIDKNSPKYKLLVKYVENTHASTHTAYKLEVIDIFSLSKETQNKRFTQSIPNKQLLWHGSRLTNFVGILSQGLRIAPPEAPVTGYMFGKGVYFADMVSKSANYCFTSRDNPTGLMLLCEVALGDCNQKFYADYYANLLPAGKMSTKGVGKTAPNGGQMLDGAFVPCGEPINTSVTHTSLLYNEFIVYDVAQIKCKYLFRMKFQYK